MKTQKRVILLNGPSSSGKSSLSKSLQSALKESGLDYAVVSIDDFMKLSTSETIYEDDVFEISQDLCDEMKRLLGTNDGVIVDHVITSQRIFDQLIEATKPYPLLSVHVSCPLEVLKQREQSRGDRCLGSAEASYQYLYPKEGYDLTIDTHAMSGQNCVKAVFGLIANAS